MNYFTMKQTAAALGITYRKLYWHLREGNLPATCRPIGQHSPLWTQKKMDALRLGLPSESCCQNRKQRDLSSVVWAGPPRLERGGP